MCWPASCWGWPARSCSLRPQPPTHPSSASARPTAARSATRSPASPSPSTRTSDPPRRSSSPDRTGNARATAPPRWSTTRRPWRSRCGHAPRTSAGTSSAIGRCSADGHPVSGESSFQYRPAGVTGCRAGVDRSPRRHRLLRQLPGVYRIVGGGALALLLARLPCAPPGPAGADRPGTDVSVGTTSREQHRTRPVCDGSSGCCWSRRRCWSSSCSPVAELRRGAGRARRTLAR